MAAAHIDRGGRETTTFGMLANHTMEQLMKVEARARLVGAAFVGMLAAHSAVADIVLDDPNLVGVVGLQGESFGSGSISVYPAGQSGVSAPLVNGSGDFAIRIEPGLTFSVYAFLNQLQNTSNASISINRSNQSAIGAAEVRTLDLVLPAGRIRGSVSVTGGALKYFNMSSSHSAANEWASGSVYSGSGLSVLEQPFPSKSGVNVSGSVTITVGVAPNSCDVMRSLTNASTSVSSGGVSDVSWSVDVSDVTCDAAVGAISGDARLDGRASIVPAPIATSDQVYASGATYRTVSIAGDGPYLVSNLPGGTYYVGRTTYLQSPYSAFFFSRSQGTSVSPGTTATADLIAGVGSAHGTLLTRGPWGFSNASGSYLYFQGPNFSAVDAINPATGGYDLLLGEGASHNYLQYSTFQYPGGSSGSSFGQFQRYFYQVAASPIALNVSRGTNVSVDTQEMETSESLVTVQVQDPLVRIRSLQLSGNSILRHPLTNAYLESRDFYLTANRNPGYYANALTVLVRGVPGTYNGTAIAQTDAGTTLSKPFTLVLGAPANTPVGPGVEQPILGTDGATLGSVKFGNVSGAGDTTVSLSSSGPEAPSNFRIYRGNQGTNSDLAYYDIRTTATFDTATVCLTYDDAAFGDNTAQESKLILAHQVCDPNDASSCDWVDITLVGFPDVVNNEICGITNSFSIFALLQPLDDDGDGVLNEVDNCPVTGNPDQSDIDSDGFGDACDSDRDGDGFPDVEDFCPEVPYPDNSDLDADGIGDICDPDADGDQVANGSDNCPIVANEEQADFDGDRDGDACDLDDDGDDVDDASDACAGTALGSWIDPAGCSSEQRFAAECPANRAYKNHGAYVSCIAHEANRQVGLGLITDAEKDTAISTAAKSSIGSN